MKTVLVHVDIMLKEKFLRTMHLPMPYRLRFGKKDEIYKEVTTTAIREEVLRRMPSLKNKDYTIELA